MRLDEIPANPEKETVRVIVETPRGSRTKYAYDPELNGIVLKKTLPEGMVFPYDFGFIPSTKGEDGDPLDALVLMDVSTVPGCIVKCRLVGLLEAKQKEKGERAVRNDRFIVVEQKSLLYQDVADVSDLPARFVKQLEEFFVAYNKLNGKHFKPLRVVGAKGAWKAFRAGLKK